LHNETLKPVKKEEEGAWLKKNNIDGMNLIEVHNEISAQLICAKKISFFFLKKEIFM
jgi:hypothetical protein